MHSILLDQRVSNNYISTLVSNQITEIPSEIFQLTRLSDFWLCKFLIVCKKQFKIVLESSHAVFGTNVVDNKLTSIPNDIAQLTNLKYLNMSKCDLEIAFESNI